MRNRPVVAKKKGKRGREGWEFGISRFELLHIEWRHNKVLQ